MGRNGSRCIVPSANGKGVSVIDSEPYKRVERPVNGILSNGSVYMNAYDLLELLSETAREMQETDRPELAKCITELQLSVGDWIYEQKRKVRPKRVWRKS